MLLHQETGSSGTVYSKGGATSPSCVGNSGKGTGPGRSLWVSRKWGCCAAEGPQAEGRRSGTSGARTLLRVLEQRFLFRDGRET